MSPFFYVVFFFENSHVTPTPSITTKAAEFCKFLNEAQSPFSVGFPKFQLFTGVSTRYT